MSEFALTLRAARAERKLSQAQLAYIADISQVTVSSIECGVHRPNKSTRKAIEEVLQIPIDWERTFSEGSVKRQVMSN